MTEHGSRQGGPTQLVLLSASPLTFALLPHYKQDNSFIHLIHMVPSMPDDHLEDPSKDMTGHSGVGLGKWVEGSTDREQFLL